MDGHRHLEPVSDASLDRAIGSLLGVEPSPEFLARVRARVAKEQEPSSWRTSWMFATAATVVLMTATAVLL